MVADGDSILVQGSGYEQPDPYSFDHVFGDKSNQAEIYRKVAEPVVQGVLNGINGTVFCYGQTGSGKTYTMEGTDEDPGLLPRLGTSIFHSATAVLEQVSVCFVEIYMEKVQDLLEPARKVEVRETMNGSVYLANACERVVSSSSELLSCVNDGQKYRSVAATKMNERSSRSHSVFSVSVKTLDNVSGMPLHGALHFVDLAGSESQGRTGAVGQTLEQSKHINQSLLGLGRVIGALGAGQPHVPYRDSKLTRILQDSLGGSARTSLIINISPEAINAFETISSLRFGQGASLVKNAPRVNLVDVSVGDLRKLLSERDAEIARLRAQLGAIRIECTPSPARAAQWIKIGTPQKAKKEPCSELEESECEETVNQCFWPDKAPIQRERSWTWMRCLVVALLTAAAYLTNPGNSEEDFRQFLQEQQMFPMVHGLVEKLGLTKIGLWNVGLAAVGRESSRLFVGAFDLWIELPGVLHFEQVPDLSWSEDHDVDAIALAFFILFVFWQFFPLVMAHHFAASSANLRAGRLWSLATAQLSHARIEQLLVNTLFLYSIGPQTHSALGRHRFFAFFFMCGACATAASLFLWSFLHRGRPAVECLGACGPLSALLSYSLAAGCCSEHARWLGRDWCWAEFALLQLLLGASAGLDMVASLIGGAAGLAVAHWQLLELVPRMVGWKAVEWQVLELVPRG